MMMRMQLLLTDRVCQAKWLASWRVEHLLGPGTECVVELAMNA